MQVTMTERDKRLLTLLACVLILVGFGWYLIKPMAEHLEQLDADIETAQMQQQEMMMKIATLPMLQTDNASLKEEVKTAAVDYYDLMTSQEVDKELTNIVVNHQLECVNLNIQPMQLSEAEPYVRSQMAREAELSAAVEELQEQMTSLSATSDAAEQVEAYAAGEAGTSGQTAPEDWVQDQIYSYQVSMTMEGSEAAYQQIIDLFTNSYPTIRVTGISYQDSLPKMVLQEDGTMIESEKIRQLTMNLELYMCDKSN